MSQSKEVDGIVRIEADSGDDLRISESSNSGECITNSNIDSSLQGSTLAAVLKGTVCFNKLVEMARAEFKIGKAQAGKQVLGMINQWQALQSFNSFNRESLSGGRVTNAVVDHNCNIGPDVVLPCGQLESPLKELGQLRNLQNAGGTKERDLPLDDRLWILTHGSSVSYGGSLSSRSQNDLVAVSPSVSASSMSQSTSTGEKENDGVIQNSKSVITEQKELGDMDVLPDDVNAEEEEGSYMDNISKMMIPVEQMSVGQRLSREVVLRELGPKECSSGVIEMWDPLACTLDADNRSRMIKEIEGDQTVIPVAGILTPPIRGKGQALFNRDNTLCKILEEVNIMMKGSAQSMALVLDNKGDEAVRRSAKLIALGANVMSRVNAERMRIHYPREFASRILKPITEPIVREVHRIKARQLAQDIRNQNTLLGPLFRKGGRGTREGAKARTWKTNRIPFPRNNFQNKFRRSSSAKIRKNHFQLNKQQASNPGS
jgi:hypothetical protein